MVAVVDPVPDSANGLPDADGRRVPLDDDKIAGAPRLDPKDVT
jgi:hypothetical protein